MKNPFASRLLCLFLLVFLHLWSHAQSRYAIDLDGGLAVPVSPNLNKAFYTGGNLSLGFKMALLPSKKLWIRPYGAAKMYVKSAGNDGVQESFITRKAGLELQYKVAEHKKYAFFSLLGVDYNWSSNYFSKELFHDPYTNTDTVGVTPNYLSGHAFAFDAGIMIVRSSRFYLKIDYEYYDPSLKVNAQLRDELLAEGTAIPSAIKLNCSTLNVGVGINFNFKK
jgi:hypothetical protein